MNRFSRISRRGFAGITLAALAASVLVPGTGRTFAQSVCGPNKPANPGLISDTEYESPTYGIAVAWDDIWEVGDDRNPAVIAAIGDYVQPVDCGIGNGGSDSLVLSHRLAPSSVARIQVYQRGMWTFDAMVEDMQKPGWVQNLRLPQGSEVLYTDYLDNSLAMVARDADDADHVVYQETTFPYDDDRFIISVTLHLWDPDAYEPVLNDAGAIEIDDFALFTVMSPDDILDAAMS
ncbi:MAG: hypothetical protein WBA63_11785 [Thermomicrobiales bacterium]